MQWLDDLQKQMNEVMAKYTIIGTQVRPGERIIGKLSEELLQLYGLSLQMKDEIVLAIDRHENAHYNGKTTDEACSSFKMDMMWKIEQWQAVRQLFWVAVRAQFAAYSGNVGIRAHGQVVVYDGHVAEEKASHSVAFEELEPHFADIVSEHVRCNGRPN